MDTRLTQAAAAVLREAIREAGGVEVFAIGDYEDGCVTSVTVTCRGQSDRVPALLDRPRTGQVVIHNHPSGNLTASDADLALAQAYGEDGVGVVIVDSQVGRANWVVEPFQRRENPVPDDLLVAFFEQHLPKSMPGWEPRPQQFDLARKIADALSRPHPLGVEAGTGSGKSLAYLVPAALWALANDGKVVVTTYTKTLQSQLLTSDLPMLHRGGLKARYAVLQGRNNYACKRRLGLAREEDELLPTEHRSGIAALAAWEATSEEGSRTDLPFEPEPGAWDRVMSDGDLTLALRCEHYATCRWYTARRSAAASHLVVVNHALLLTDLVVRAESDRGVLPKFQRVIVDEAHHLEDAATGAASSELSSAAIRRAALPLLDQKSRAGALRRVLLGPATSLQGPSADAVEVAVLAANAEVEGLAAMVPDVFRGLGEVAVPQGEPLRITPQEEASDRWKMDIAPQMLHLAEEVERAVHHLRELESTFEGQKIPEAQSQPLLDVQRAARRLSGHAEVARAFLEEGSKRCRWIERTRELRGTTSSSLKIAPVEVSDVLREILWSKYLGVACTSATLAVAGSFDHFIARTAAGNPDTASWPSPFDHAAQALLALPRDVPSPDDPHFLEGSGRAIVDAVRISDGGAFVLCTSFEAVRRYASALREALPSGQPVLAQGEAGRPILLERFRENPRAVLVGTDSFWEGVSVKGEGLRLVIIPRLPFRVPTEPLRVARHEAITAQGGDPFRAYSLPEAVIKLRQGYGRLIRSHTDRGVVLLLDRRVHERWYGQVILRSLPPARRIVGPWRRVAEEMTAFFAKRGSPGGLS
jgi:ATP-dependent DNA helicase DinG